MGFTHELPYDKRLEMMRRLTVNVLMGYLSKDLQQIDKNILLDDQLWVENNVNAEKCLKIS